MIYEKILVFNSSDYSDTLQLRYRIFQEHWLLSFFPVALRVKCNRISYCTVRKKRIALRVVKHFFLSWKIYFQKSKIVIYHFSASFALLAYSIYTSFRFRTYSSFTYSRSYNRITVFSLSRIAFHRSSNSHFELICYHCLQSFTGPASHSVFHFQKSSQSLRARAIIRAIRDRRQTIK